VKRVLESGRYLALLGVFSALAASAAAFMWGTYKTIQLIIRLVQSKGDDPLTAVALLELMDKFLIAAGLYIFAVGIFELFVDDLDLPDWLTTHGLHTIKGQLSSIIVLLLAILFLERFIRGQDALSTLYLALAVSVVIGALIAFNYFSKKE
jgi:uncharacterized membrane protein YqhA